MGSTPSWHWGSVFKTTQFLRRDVIMKILGRARWDSCCCTLGGQSLESDISQVCMLPAYNYPSSFVCRLNTIIKTQHTEPGRETPGHKQDRVTTRQSAADIIIARKGKLNSCPPTVQCLSQTGVREGGGWENMFLFTSSSLVNRERHRRGILGELSNKLPAITSSPFLY